VNHDLVIVGSGLFGLTIAERCANELGLGVLVIDKRDGLLSVSDSVAQERTAWAILSAYVREQDPRNRIFVLHRLDRGTFIYNVDFATRQGDGRIENISRFGMITLKNAALTEMNGGFGVTGNASDRYKQPLVYQAMFYGNRAEEMAGQVVNTDNRDVVGFHGARGDIVQ